jgi:Tol biopolymer transport system component
MYGWVDRKTPHICCGLKYVVDLHTGRHRLVVTKGPAQGVDALWAPDGRQIAFSVYGSGWGKAGLWVADSDGTHPTQMTPFPDELLSWSPDGLALALSRHPFKGEQGPTQLTLFGLGDRATFATNVGSAIWSPDSQWIVYSKTEQTGTHLYLAAADGRETKQLTFGPASVQDTWPQWLPNNGAARP